MSLDPRPAAETSALERLAPPIAELIRRMPKAELHLHIDGSLRPQTALELAREAGIDEGLDVDGMRRRLVGPPSGTSQAELLTYFDLPVRLMQTEAALERITRELVEDVATDGTQYAELRWAPSLHVAGGLTLEKGIEAVVRGAEAGAAATSVVVRLIAVALRSHPPATSLAVAQASTRFLDRGLSGFDLAGQEAEHPDPKEHAEAFETARAAGLGITIHAGEWGGSAQVRRALGVDPARIAHGAPVADDPSMVSKLIQRDVTLDLCPTSNVQAGVVPDLASHPLARLHRLGVPVTLSTDDRTVSGLTLTEEYARAVDVIGLSLAELWAIDRHALEAAFLHHDEHLRARLLAEFDSFAAVLPALNA